MRILLGILCLCSALILILSQLYITIDYIEDEEEENK